MFRLRRALALSFFILIEFYANIRTTADPPPNTSNAISLNRHGWTVVADSAQPGNEAENILDGHHHTFWHTSWDPTDNPMPHSITIDMKDNYNVHGLSYLPRQDDQDNGNIGEYSIYLSADGTTWGSPAATGTWEDDENLKYAYFSGNSIRYVRLIIQSEAGGRGSWASAAEIEVLSNPDSTGCVSRKMWVVKADSVEKIGEEGHAKNAFDDDPNTYWHTEYYRNESPLPHNIIIDLRDVALVYGLTYLPRNDGVEKGRIGQFTVEYSKNGRTWNTVVTGQWADDATLKSTTFTPTTARFVRFTALTEAGDRCSYISAAEINVLSSKDCSKNRRKHGPSAGAEKIDKVCNPDANDYLPRDKWIVKGDSVEKVDDEAHAKKAIDGDLNTYWHTEYYRKESPLPHNIIIDLRDMAPVHGLTYLPRNDGVEKGRIGHFKIECSKNGRAWDIVATGQWADDDTLKCTTFTPTTARFVRLTALTEAGNRCSYISAAEINLLSAKAPAIHRRKHGRPKISS
ncbi:unnamed protein product [Adineta steineri]|uniref:F5/8 type C domain-containing protein n=1 Tax=Adineta steineri TaxID=433720 RepID=A0A818W176_9BILA|nr:unnamed protein product [Adineta steineri]CAF3718229.1 unnamed protein product [Adineta steineri]